MKRIRKGDLRRFGRIEGSRRALLIEAALWLIVARVALLAVPFRLIASRLGCFVRPSAAPVQDAPAAFSPAQIKLAVQVGWAVNCAARYAPFGAVCLPQAIVGKMMLNRRGVPGILRLGVGKRGASDVEFEAHAWLNAAGVEVTGYPVAPGFVEIASFI